MIHVILDNYAAHKHPNVRKWLARHPRWVFHFTPTSCSWLNAIEGFFAKLTRRRLKRGTFPSLVALQEAINRFIEHHNQAPKPFTWKADPKAIIAAANGASNVGDNPLDPFAGSNTTGRVAEDLERRWIAVDVKESYVRASGVRFGLDPSTL